MSSPPHSAPPGSSVHEEPSAPEPGQRLSGRYLLEDRLERAAPDAAGAVWRGLDETLHRLVSIWTLAADAPNADALLDSARDAARLNDPRFARILDADRYDGFVYVVSEWVDGTDLASRLRDGPLPVHEARALIMAIADGLSAAHAAGLAHTRLTPGRITLGDSGQVKIVGLRTDAAFPRPPVLPEVDDPVEADTRACGGLLYAALTGRWPGGVMDGLPAAPHADGHLCSPRQVLAGVPHDLDLITCRALGEPRRRGLASLRTPAELGAALQSAHLPPPNDAGVAAAAAPPPPVAAVRPGRPTRLARTIAGTVLAAGLAMAAWQLGVAAFENNGDPPAPEQTSPTEAATPTPSGPTGTLVRVKAVRDFDPEGNGQENPRQVRRAVDADPDTAWRTETYYSSPDLNGLKSGVGLLLDLGSPQPVATVTLDLLGRGTNFEIRAANTRGDEAKDYAVVAQMNDVGSLVTLSLDARRPARYLLVWLTSLPTESVNRYVGGISEITVRR